MGSVRVEVYDETELDAVYHQFEDATSWTVDYETDNLIVLKAHLDRSPDSAVAEFAKGVWKVVSLVD